MSYREIFQVFAIVRFGWSVLAPVLAAICWVSVLAPVIARLFGVPLAIGLWGVDKKNNHLSTAQYVVAYGTLSWGLGLFIFFGGYEFLRSRLGDRYAQSSLGYTLLLAAICLVSGAVGAWLRCLRKAAFGAAK